MGPFGSLSSQSSLVDVEAVVIMFFLEENHEKLNEGEGVCGIHAFQMRDSWFAAKPTPLAPV